VTEKGNLNENGKSKRERMEDIKFNELRRKQTDGDKTGQGLRKRRGGGGRGRCLFVFMLLVDLKKFFSQLQSV
jgi:hypothetical protein